MARRVSKSSPLLYADSELNADQLYFGKAFVPDRFISFGIGKRKYALVSALEFSRLRKDSDFTEVLSLEEWQKSARKTFRRKKVGLVEVIRLLAREFEIPEFVISEDFPAGLAFKLKAASVKLRISEGALFPERLQKSDAEARAIKVGNAASAAGIRAAERLLRDSRMKNGRLVYAGRALTSERVRHAIRVACLERGAVSMQTIVAGGDQACDPHCSGSGPLRANELIIVDVFPRVAHTGYFGDMTRTFLKGRASEAQRRLVATVRSAQQKALGVMKAGVSGARIHRMVEEYFAKEGFETTKINGTNVGFFHGTGHGLGLEIHEPPRVSRKGPRLRAGMVTSVEPGLYYPGLGGCRIEDVVRVKREGVEMLSKFHYRWEIRK